jgi:hypothetical protein
MSPIGSGGSGPDVEAEVIFAAIDGQDPRAVTALYDRMSWSCKQAVRHVGESARTLDLTWFEEPVRRWDADGLAAVSRGVRTVVASGEDLGTRTRRTAHTAGASRPAAVRGHPWTMPLRRGRHVRHHRDGGSMKAVVHHGARTLEIESRVAEALRADPQRDQALLGRIQAGRRRRADDFAGATVCHASPASAINGIVLPVDGGRLGR